MRLLDDSESAGAGKLCGRRGVLRGARVWTNTRAFPDRCRPAGCGTKDKAHASAERQAEDRAMRRTIARRLLTSLALAAALPLPAGAAAADPLTIRVGWSTMPGHLIPVLFTKPAILKHYGKSYTV